MLRDCQRCIGLVETDGKGRCIYCGGHTDIPEGAEPQRDQK